MRICIVSTVVAAASMCVLTAASMAQTAMPPQHVPLQKTIGQAARAEVVPSLFVLNSRGATLQGGKLTLTGVSPNAIVFADRPVRSAGHELTAHILEEWSPTNTDADSFAKDPPNATVSAFMKAGTGVRDAVVVLKNPVADGDRVTFDVDVLEGDLTGADGPASIFIDIIGRPATPRSFAGAARRGGYRGAYYRGVPYGAAAVGAAAAGAAAYGAYAVPRPLCGYYPYPPCY
jgi:hypothetical protein